MAAYLWDLHVSAIVSDSPSVEVWLADLAADCRSDARYTMFLASAPLNVLGGTGYGQMALVMAWASQREYRSSGQRWVRTSRS
jgi:hypothetical protein